MSFSFFYKIKRFIPRSIQIGLRRIRAKQKVASYSDVWPILESANNRPAGFPDWPDGKKFAFVLMHDVEHAAGQAKVAKLSALEKERGFRSSFNFVPERYKQDYDLHKALKADGFEIGVHGLNHDGTLFSSKDIFKGRAPKINQYLKDWDADGFCSPSSFHNLSWMHDLDINYESSTFDTDPFEPQSDGVETIYPFWVENPDDKGKGFVELPYTLPQDHLLYIILQEKSPDIWKRKLDWIAENGGMALVITHPDYMNFGQSPMALEEYPVEIYSDFLDYARKTYGDDYWHANPCEVAEFLKNSIQDLVHA